jgi:hypothetical protein
LLTQKRFVKSVLQREKQCEVIKKSKIKVKSVAHNTKLN